MTWIGPLTSAAARAVAWLASGALLLYGVAVAASGSVEGWDPLVAFLGPVLGLAGLVWVVRSQFRVHGWRHLPSWLLLVPGATALLTAVLAVVSAVLCDGTGFSCGG